MTYHKAMTGSVPLCPLMFSCFYKTCRDISKQDYIIEFRLPWQQDRLVFLPFNYPFCKPSKSHILKFKQT